MKVIDLLNKIANGEEVPKKVKYDEKVWAYDEGTQDYIYEQTPLYTNFLLQKLIGGCEATKELLFYEIEIIEEYKEIEKLYHCYMENDNQEIKFLIQNINDLSDKINEIRIAVNELKKGK